MSKCCLENEYISVMVDSEYPQVLEYCFKQTGGILKGGDNLHNSTVKVNGEPCRANISFKQVDKISAEYKILFSYTAKNGPVKAGFVSRIYLYENSVYKTIENVFGDMDDRGFEIAFMTPLLVAYSQEDALAVSSFDIDCSFERIGKVSNLDSFIKENCAFTFMWNENAAAGVYTPSASHCPYTVEVTYDKCGKIYEGVYYHRYKDGHRSEYETSDGKIFETKYTVIVGITGDKNLNGTIDWQDAALWQRDVIPQPDEKLKNFFDYGEWRQVHLAFPKAGGDYYSNPVFTIVYSTLKQLLETQKRIFRLTDGTVRKSYEMVGWQGRGHDYGWPDLSEQPFNPAIGTVEYFNSFRKQFEEYGGDLSFHINQTDISDYTSCLYRRGGVPHVFGNAQIKAEQLAYDYNTFGWTGFSLSHYEDFRRGYARARQDAFAEKYFSPFIMYSDVMLDRPAFGYSHIEEQYAKARNMQHWKALGINMATEYYAPEKYLNGQFMFNTYKFPTVIDSFMTSGRIQLHNTQENKNKDCLFGIKVSIFPGCESNWYLDGNRFAEKQAYSIYMYSYYNAFLRRKGICSYSENDKSVTVHYGKDTTAEYDKKTDTFCVKCGDTLIADENTRLIPDVYDKHRAFMFSISDRAVNWVLPEMWRGRSELYLYRMTVNGRRFAYTVKSEKNTVLLRLKAGEYYILYDEKKSEPDVTDYSFATDITASCSEYISSDEFDVSGGMQRRMIPAESSPDKDWRKTIMLLNDRMADTNGNIYYYYPCCCRTVADGDDDTYWRAVFDGEGNAEIKLDFRGELISVKQIEIDSDIKDNILCVVIGIDAEGEKILYSGSPCKIEISETKLFGIKLKFKGKKTEIFTVKRISVY